MFNRKPIQKAKIISVLSSPIEQLPKEKRLFLGIPISACYVEAFQAFQVKQRFQAGIRWIPPKNYHITQYFFGNVPSEQIPNLIQLIGLALQQQQSFSLSFDRIAFPPRYQPPRMIWARFHKCEEFRRIGQELERLYQQIQPVQGNRKSPIPHASLARLKPSVDFELFQFDVELNCAPLEVRELVLWESVKRGEGVDYVELGRFGL